MPRNGARRGEDKKENDLKRISELRLRGLSQTAIAQELNLSQSQVSLDLKSLRSKWQQEQTGNIDGWISEQIAYYEDLLKTSRKAWELSLEETTSEVRESGVTPKGEVDRLVVKKSPGRGNPMYLQQIDSCLKAISRLRGIDTHLKYWDVDRAVIAVCAAGYQVCDPGTGEPVPIPKPVLEEEEVENS